MGLNKKLRFSQKLMHYYEKHRNLRIGFGVAMGTFLSFNFLAVYPGSSIIMQKPIKKFVARSYLQYSYISNFYIENIFIDSSKAWEKSLIGSLYYLNQFRRDVIFI
jgi:hypothetical protein